MLKTYLLAYNDEVGTREELTAFIDGLPEVLNWRYDIPNVFYILSDASAKDLSQLVKEFSKDKGRHIIAEVSGSNKEGWVPSETWNFLRRSPDYNPDKERESEPGEEWQKEGIGYKEGHTPLSAVTLNQLETIKSKYLDWDNTTGSARKWWEAFERENEHRLELVIRLAEELANRKATITEFFLAYVYSNTENILANLHYLDYTRLKKEEERKKRIVAEAAAKEAVKTENTEKAEVT